MAEVELGKVTHYFAKIGVAAIEIQHDSLAVGDTIHVKGHTSDFTQNVDSMQVDHQPVTVAKPGESVGIHMSAARPRARQGLQGRGLRGLLLVEEQGDCPNSGTTLRVVATKMGLSPSPVHKGYCSSKSMQRTSRACTARAGS